MWLLSQLKSDDLKSKGLAISISDIYSMEKASIAQSIVKLGSGTAAIISEEGLALTCRHLLLPLLQNLWECNYNLRLEGVSPKKRNEEIVVPGLVALVFQSLEDITAEIRMEKDLRSDLLRKDSIIQKKIDEIKKQKQNGKTDIYIETSSFYGGNLHYLFFYKRIEDIRVVYIPPESIGNFGGEKDNWKWPRYCGDFALIRLYTDPEGKGRKYHRDNLPYKPENHLNISSDALKEGDSTFVLGYPQKTNRYCDSHSMGYYLNSHYPASITDCSELITILEKTRKHFPEESSKLVSYIEELSNTKKYYEGMMISLTKSKIQRKKKKFENKLVQFFAYNQKLKIEFHQILEQLKAMNKQAEKTKDRDEVLNLFRGYSGFLPSLAYRIYHFASKKEKPTTDRQNLFSEEIIRKITTQLYFQYRNYSWIADMAFFKRFLEKALGLREEHRINELNDIISQPEFSPLSYTKHVYNNSSLNNLEFVKKLFYKSRRELELLGDPLIDIAAKLYPLLEEFDREREIYNTKRKLLNNRYIDVIFKCYGDKIPADANATLRITFGQVIGYRNKEQIHFSPFTKLKEAISKQTGQYPFLLPLSISQLHRNKNLGKWIDPLLRDVPIAFICSCDTTMGSSGSPVLDRNGKLVGLVFDKNFESISGDWVYEKKIQRAIAVDLRYILFILDKLPDARFLMKELTGVKND